MKKFLLLAMCALVSGLALGQDAHYEYSSNSLDFVSSTVITNVYTDQQYLVATTQTMELVVTELEPNNFLAPSNTNSKYFQIGNLICINGGFIDEDENIVVYGFIYPYKNGFIVKVEMNNGVANSLKYIKNPNANTPVVDGCWSRKSSQGATSMTYDFILGEIFMRINNDLTSPIYRTLSGISYCSVAWDDINNKHIVCGNRNGSFIVTHFGSTNALTPTVSRTLTLPTGYSFSEGTNRIVLSDIDSVVFLSHDLRYADNTGDGLWISKFNYLSGQLYSSDIYKFGHEKVWILDADKCSDYLYILGHHNGYDNGTFERKYIAQINMYDNTDYTVRLMSDYNLYPTIMPDPYGPFPFADTINLLYLNNLNSNPNYPSIIASGAFGGKSYAVEVYDLNYEEECDIDKSVSQYSISPTIQTQTIRFSQYSWNPTVVTITTSTNISYTNDVLCPSYDALREIQDALKNNFANREKSLKRNYESSQEFDKENLPEISVLDNRQFVCHNFEGECNFQIIDLSGHILYEGSTSNEKYNTISVKANGIYIVRVVDSNGNFVSSKIALMNY